MAKVFLIEQPRIGIDISSAEKFGEIVYVFDSHERRSSVFSERFKSEFIQQLINKGYDPKRDYICIAGSMIAIVICVSCVFRQLADHVKVLLFNATEGRYVERTL